MGIETQSITIDLQFGFSKDPYGSVVIVSVKELSIVVRRLE